MADKQQIIKGGRLHLSGDNDDNKNRSNGDGWESYRRWLAKMSSPGPRRLDFDDRLYTWSGYRDWMSRVKRDWDDES